MSASAPSPARRSASDLPCTSLTTWTRIWPTVSGSQARLPAPGDLPPLPALANLFPTPVQAQGSQPVAPLRPVTDTYFGTPVVDNYRYMEKLDDPEVQNWMKAQAA